MLRKEMLSKKDECARLIKKTNKARKIAEQQNHEALHNIRLAEEHVT